MALLAAAVPFLIISQAEGAGFPLTFHPFSERPEHIMWCSEKKKESGMGVVFFPLVYTRT